MKKALITGIVAFALASAAGAGAVIGTVGHSAAQESASFTAVPTAVLRQGSKGGEVKEVQRRLKQWGYYKGSVDGIYGAQTVEAVKAFQRKNGLTADGIAGRATFVALGMNDSVNVLDNHGSGSSSSSSYTNSDLYLLAKCIYAEARGESYTGQVAVGAVILNRVASSAFPNTVAGVIYQKDAFTAVSDGQINLEPDKTAMNAATDALNGWDPTYGCLYYYNPAVATSSWIFGRKTVTTIGKHVFAI
ncbi:MAG: spore cortex-lytic enzyme [Clostridia bacterium]|nr:spore cortex-lytic enzyme [Clostridia bacterium]